MESVYLINAKYLGGHKVFLQFNDGKQGVVDLLEVVSRFSIAEPLKDPKKFSRFFLDSWPTLAWDCGFDIAPETLYERCERMDSADG